MRIRTIFALFFLMGTLKSFIDSKLLDAKKLTSSTTQESPIITEQDETFTKLAVIVVIALSMLIPLLVFICTRPSTSRWARFFVWDRVEFGFDPAGTTNEPLFG